MRSLIVGVADCRVSDDPENALVTYGLGSCIAIAIYDLAARVGGLLHFMLPESSIDPVKARENPYMFADTGIPLLFHGAYERGAQKDRIIVRAAGGAQVMDDQGVFDIGKRNYLAMRKILWKAGVLVHGEAVGGTISRSVRLELATGRMWLKGTGEAEQELPYSFSHAKGADPWRSAC